jgi:CRISPR-associated endonuclease/helicase Cas3
MMVTFVAQCEKKALNRTRRVLDSFANRIGSRTWHTVITAEGLQAVKKLLRKTASKNTAVACHWMRSRSRNELVWIVGNRRKYNEQGIVPVNTTQKTVFDNSWEDSWRYLPLIKALVALAALFHDWGKASRFFQEKLKAGKIIGDPLRHEWISILFLNAYINGETDLQWLTRLNNGEFDEETLKAKVRKAPKKPLVKLPGVAKLIIWLIMSHHRLPVLNDNEMNGWLSESDYDTNKSFKRITQKWGYENQHTEEELAQCFDYPVGLPHQSRQWLKQVKKWSQRLLDCLPLVECCMQNSSWRLVLNYSRLALMLGDHHFSSLDANPGWSSEYALYANTDRETKKFKQKLDEHLVGVARKALFTTHLLPAIEGTRQELPRVYDIKALKQKSPPGFQWQDKAVQKIQQWREASAGRQQSTHFGFFAVNMASTGKGKTFANAKIMRALSPDTESLRYILALGLRSLTLQTGAEYRDRIRLDESELAVMIGSRAVLDLHKVCQQRDASSFLESLKDSGSESLEPMVDEEVDFDSDIPETTLSTLLGGKDNPDQRARKIFYAPVLACTIDHMMAATETVRGGRYMLPTMRLMSSDLVIDEIDDFDGGDLIAIGRLIHLAGMLGRKVMISSATIPPDLAEGYLNAYQCGWALFAASRDIPKHAGCAWIDEFGTQLETLKCATNNLPAADFRNAHQRFIDKRIARLLKQPAKRKAEIVPSNSWGCTEANTDQTIQESYFSDIQQAVIGLHNTHAIQHRISQKHLSFGVVRVANIGPCIALTQYLLQSSWPQDYEVRVMAYHSQQVLLMRSYQERHLDNLLKRNKEDDQAIFRNGTIRQHIENCKQPNLIFILVATPVEEIGRDHDFDWAVVEPSSYRSIIQLAGRVLRHRDQATLQPNIALMQTNLKAMTQGDAKPAFCRPGYESRKNRLDTHDLNQLLDTKQLAESIDARPRIQRAGTLEPATKLADLEHYSIHEMLTCYEQHGPETLQGWLSENWWMTALPQAFNRFRNGTVDPKVYIVPVDENSDNWEYLEKDPSAKGKTFKSLYHIDPYELPEEGRQRLWLYRDYKHLLEEVAEKRGMELRQVALTYGEITLPAYGGDATAVKFIYSSQLGLSKQKD